MTRKIFFVEGECEKSFIENMYKSGYQEFTGRKNIEIFNICCDSIKKIQKKFAMRNMKVYFVFDVDILIENKHNEQNIFNQNFNLLKNTQNEKYYIIQVQNFEDELLHCCSGFNRNKNKLFETFNANNERRFKENFIHQCNNIQKLQENDFNILKLWVQNLPDILSSYKFNRKTGANFK